MTTDTRKTPVQRTRKKRYSKAAMRRRRRRRWIFAIEALLLVVLGGALVLFSKTEKLQPSEIKGKEIIVNDIDNDAIDGFTNVALFGIDSREVGSFGSGNHSDTIIVASINNKTKEIKLVSVYRDTYLNQSNDKYNKATQAYYSGGPQQAINMLNMNLDLDITEYVTVDFAAITNVVDALGGITIDVTSEELEHLNNYTVETSKVTGVKTNKLTETGEQLLDGVQTTSYARIRYTAGDDYKRTERQRLVISKIIEKAKSADLATLNKIVDEVFPQVSTSFTLTEILGLAKDVVSYNLGETAGFPFDKTAASVGSKGACVIPIGLDNNVAQLHEFLFGETDYVASDTVKTISAKITNDTGVQSVASKSTGSDIETTTEASEQ